MEISKKIIGVCASQLQDEGNFHLLRTIAEYGEKLGFKVLVYGAFAKMDIVDAHVRGEASIYSRIPMEELVSLIILGEAIQYGELLEGIRDSALKAGVPVITIDYEMENCFNILLKYHSTFEAMVRHIIEDHQSKNPYFMSGFKGNIASEERLQVYKQVLRENDLPVIEKHIAYGDFWEAPSKLACEKWAEGWEDDLPDAIICANDMMAITVCNVVKEHGLRVPEDVIVSGFDGIDLERYCTPRLTTARVNHEEIGRQMMEIIQRNLEDPGLKPYSVRVPFHMRCSESCGCQKVQYDIPNKYVMEVYGRMSHNRQYVDRMFQMMTKLTEGYSMRETVKQLCKCIKNVTSKDLMLFVNRKFCRHTDILGNRKIEKGQMLLLLEQNHQRSTIPLELWDKNKIYNLSEQIWKEHQTMLFLPVHWQGEVYGCMAIQYLENEVEYERLNDFMWVLAQIFGSVKKQSHLHEMYIMDSLTSLYNRRGFYSEFARQMKRLSGKEKKIFFASVDLDRLKPINDNYGHAEGDNAIRQIAEALKKAIFPGGFFARFGGDEFVAAYLWDANKPEQDYCSKFEERLQEVLKRWNQKTRKPYRVDASYGTIVADIYSANDLDDIMKIADEKMYHCKERHHSIRDSKREESNEIYHREEE